MKYGKEFKQPFFAIPLFNFKYNHKPFPSSPNTSPNPGRFIGREKELRKLLDILIATRKKRGSYLIAGYRGVGKTSYVNEVIRRYKGWIKENKKQRELIDVRINLGNEQNLNTKIIMSNMVTLLGQRISEKHESNKKYFNFYTASYLWITVGVGGEL